MIAVILRARLSGNTKSLLENCDPITYRDWKFEHIAIGGAGCRPSRADCEADTPRTHLGGDRFGEFIVVQDQLLEVMHFAKLLGDLSLLMRWMFSQGIMERRTANDIRKAVYSIWE